MDQTLSVILPVQNAQGHLARQVSELLEMLPELTSRFEILILDDGSTDRTEEVAHDLTVRYPQVTMARNSGQRGVQASIETAVSQTSGEVMIVLEDASPSPSQLRRLWELRHDQSLVMAQADSHQRRRVDSKVISRLVSWGNRMQSETPQQRSEPGIRMLRRQAIHQMVPEEPLTVDNA